MSRCGPEALATHSVPLLRVWRHLALMTMLEERGFQEAFSFLEFEPFLGRALIHFTQWIDPCTLDGFIGKVE